MPQIAELFPLDQQFSGYRGLTGIDEAGRGCLAGPVVVASVTWSPQVVRNHSWFVRLADSKQIDAVTRADLFPHILAAATRVRVAVIHPILIDALNILQATFHGFELVAPAPDQEVPLVIDGHLRPASLKWAGTQVKGDALISAVAAAGILAKVTRDALMVPMAKRWPVYGFAKHKGYATAEHRRAIAVNGPCPIHRKSFRPVRDGCESPLRDDAGFLSRLERAVSDEVPGLFGEFRDRYHLFSIDAAHRAIAGFTQKGCRVLPAPTEASLHAGQRRWDQISVAGL